MATTFETPRIQSSQIRRDNHSSRIRCDWSCCSYLLSSVFFLSFGLFVILSAFGYLGKTLHLYMEVCWYIGMIFVLCGIITCTQCYFHVRDKCFTVELRRRRRRLWLQTNRASDGYHNENVLPQWVTQLIHDQLHHLSPGEELLINLPMNSIDSITHPPPYEVVVVQGACDAPPPTYVEAIALLNHQHTAGFQDEKSTASADEMIPCHEPKIQQDLSSL